jgi:hypothetical protein
MTLNEYLQEKNATPVVFAAVEELGLDLDEEIDEIDRDKIHSMVSFQKAYLIDEYVFGTGELEKLLYYVGAEKSAKLVFMFGKFKFYEVDDTDRFPIIGQNQ